MDEPVSRSLKEDVPTGTSTSSRNGANANRGTRRQTFLKSLVVITALLYFLYPYRTALWPKLAFVAGCLSYQNGCSISRPPNIVFILTDDQDFRLGSLNYMPTLQERVIGEGVLFENHFGTVALCCPGRATLFRGQAAHNTNITHVGGMGGGYGKWRRTGEWKNYLPLWLQQAGYTTAYFGKFMNGYSINNYKTVPEGWDWTDILTGRWIYDFNHVVMSENGEHPLYYEGWHQIDVLRLKALNRLKWMTAQDKPFYLEIAPASPHVRPGGAPTVPPARYMDYFPGLGAPRLPNHNPADEYTLQKPAWLKDMPLMNESIVQVSDLSMRRRVQALQGVDDLVADIIAILEKAGILDETYIIYTTDNGFHLGNHRLAGGKGQSYREDVNLPFAVRGPGIPAGHVSTIPQTHVDVAPTLLQIAGLPREYWPPFFDGRSLLEEWRTLTTPEDGISREILNVEFWGSTVIPAGRYTRHMRDNSYKSLRIVSEKQGYLFNRWCWSNQTELYDTTADFYELTNLALNPSNETQRLMDRLSGLLLVTKSCGRESCRKPWEVLRDGCGCNATFSSLAEAMDAEYDDFFASLPHFGFQSCMNFQSVDNEGPYYPAESVQLGAQWREWLTDDDAWRHNGTELMESSAANAGAEGSWAQRHGSFLDLIRDRRPLSVEEIGWPVIKCDESNEFCGEEWDDD